MCFDHDSQPPISPIAGGALNGRLVTIEAADGNRFAAFRAHPATPTGAGVVILPDVRGLYPFYEELALRFAEHGIDAVAIDWFGRTAGVAQRDAEFEYLPHVARTTWAGIGEDIAAAAARLRADDVSAVFTVGFCMGGRMSFLASTLGLDLAGVIGLYGTLVGAWRNDAPAPVDRVRDIGSPVLGLFGGADEAITSDAIAAFQAGLQEAGLDHRVVVYPGAPHSFFDRKASEYADASAAAWAEILTFIRERTSVA
jgi:carboxymethylenebutenolidase